MTTLNATIAVTADLNSSLSVTNDLNSSLTGTILTDEVIIEDDGTYYIFYYDSTKIFKIRKSDGQLFLEGGITTDATL